MEKQLITVVERHKNSGLPKGVVYVTENVQEQTPNGTTTTIERLVSEGHAVFEGDIKNRIKFKIRDGWIMGFEVK